MQTGRKRWVVAFLAALVLLVCVPLTALVLVDRDSSSDDDASGAATVDGVGADARRRVAGRGDDLAKDGVVPPPTSDGAAGDGAHARVVQPMLPSEAAAPDDDGVAAEPAEPGDPTFAAALAVTQTLRRAKRPTSSTGAGAGDGPDAVDTRPGLLAVRVLAAEDGAPLRDAFVEPSGQGAPAGSSVGSDGRATLTFLHATVCDIRITASGRVRALRRRLRTRPGDDISLEVRLPVATTVVGEIRDPGGIPIEGADVRVHDARAWRAAIPFRPVPSSLAEAVTDREGRYSLEGVPRLRELVVTASAGRRTTAVRTLTTAVRADASQVVDMALAAGDALIVRVTDGDGKPAVGAWVVAWPAASVGSLARVFPAQVEPRDTWIEALAWIVFRDVFQRDAVLVRRARADADGFASVRGLATDTEYCAMAFLGRDRSSGVAVLHPGDAFADLHLAPRVDVIHRVEFDGNPVAGAEVTVFAYPARPVTLTTGRNGETAAVSVCTGPVGAEVVSSVNASMLFLGSPQGLRNVGICELQPGAVADGVVVDADDLPVAGAAVSVGTRTARSDLGGTFHLEGVSRDADVLTVCETGFVPWRQRFRPWGEPLRIHLVRGDTLRVPIELPADAPAPTWYRIAWHAERGGELQSEERLGRPPALLEIPDVPVGDCHVGLLVDGCCEAHAVVEVGPDAPPAAALAPLAAPFLTGRIAGGGGRALEGAVLTVAPAEPRDVVAVLCPPFAIVVGPSGVFAVPSPTMDDVRLTASAGGFLPATLRVQGGRDRVVLLEMMAAVTLRGSAYRADGTPAAGGWVQALPAHEPGLFATATIDAEGHFAMRIGRQDCRVVGGVDGRVWEPVRVRESDLDATVILRKFR